MRDKGRLLQIDASSEAFLTNIIGSTGAAHITCFLQQVHCLDFALNLVLANGSPLIGPLVRLLQPTIYLFKRIGSAETMCRCSRAPPKRIQVDLEKYNRPDHWYYDKISIQCQVHGCGFTTQPNGLIKQFGDMKKHCTDTPGVDHAIFLIMLGQRSCAICSYRVKESQTSSNKIRTLLSHEQSTHDSDSMSRFGEYIVLARKGRIDGRIGQDSQKIIFDRMVEKLQGFEQPITHLLCQREGLPHSLSNLRRILSTDCLRPDEDDTQPVPPERFLWQLRPDEKDPADAQWGRVWKRLRQMYSNGHL